MNKLAFAFLLLTACTGKTVDLESTSSDTEPVSVCHDWTRSFCGSSIPHAGELETIRLMDQISREDVDRLDVACLGILGRVHRPIPADGVDAEASVQAHCAAAHDVVAPVLDAVSVAAPLYILGPVLGCDPAVKSRRGPGTETITVGDHDGAYPLEAEALRLALVDIFNVRADVLALTDLDDSLTTAAPDIAGAPPDCIPTAVAKMGDAAGRISVLAETTAYFSTIP